MNFTNKEISSAKKKERNKKPSKWFTQVIPLNDKWQLGP